MYRSFLRVVHLKSLLIFGSRLKRRVPFGFGADYPNKYFEFSRLLWMFVNLYTFFHFTHTRLAYRLGLILIAITVKLEQNLGHQWNSD